VEIALLLFDGVTALDAVGPYEVLRRVPGARLRVVAREPGPVRSEAGGLGLVADLALEEVPAPEIVVVPGGRGTRAIMGDEGVLRWLRTAHETSRWTASVCTGALLLGAAGILRGRRATTHWMGLSLLEGFGATVADERVVVDGRVITAAGVSAGIDMALRLVATEAGEEHARAVQLSIEYDPQPPFDSGSPERAGERVRALAATVDEIASG
jgi:transcriptional regulator GlxA family with amidase domain